ncbi:hypothetical protein KHQ82_02400 [Mycoplasmatota bacterium]|nr:hypothetical protein KHQ82_02400 [Mycoplasmatota bacterium]
MFKKKIIVFIIFTLLLTSCVSKETEIDLYENIVKTIVITVNEDNYYVLTNDRPIKLLNIYVNEETVDEIINHDIVKYGTPLVFEVHEDIKTNNILTATKIYSTTESTQIFKGYPSFEVGVITNFSPNKIGLSVQPQVSFSPTSISFRREGVICDRHENIQDSNYQCDFTNVEDKFKVGDLVAFPVINCEPFFGITSSILYNGPFPVPEDVLSHLSENSEVLYLGVHGENKAPLYYVEEEYCASDYVIKVDGTTVFHCPNKYKVFYMNEYITIDKAIEKEVFHPGYVQYIGDFTYP